MSSKTFIAIVLIALVSVMAACLMISEDSSAAVDDTFTDGDFDYRVTEEGFNNKVEVIGYHGSSADVYIPYDVTPSYTTYDVTGIDESVFASTNITSVHLRNVTTLRYYAFRNCESLTTVDGPNVEIIGENAFSGCVNLTTFYGGNLYGVGISAFEGCAKLETIDLSGVNFVEGSSFKDCAKLESVDISSITSVGSYAFYGSGLKSLTIPASANHIDVSAFNNCASLPTITCLGTKYKIEKGALVENNTTLKTLLKAYSPSNGHYIIDSSITTIADGAFDGCDKLVTVRIPTTVTAIGGGIFRNCGNLTHIEAAEGSNFRVDNNILYSNDRTAVYYVPPSYSGEYDAPAGLTTVRPYSFLDCTAITSVNIPNVSNIGDYGFSNCYNVTEIYLRSDVSIGTRGLSLGAEGHETSCKVYSDAANFIGSLKKNTYTDVVYYLSITFEGVDTPQGATVPEKTYAEKNTIFNLAPTKATLAKYGFVTKIDGVLSEENSFSVGTTPHIVTFQFDGRVLYTLTFNTDGGYPAIAPMEIYSGEAIPEIIVQPSKAGYEFVSWSPVIPATMPANDLTINAVWKRVVGTAEVITEGNTKKVTVTENEAEIARDAIDLLLAGSENVLITVNGVSIKMPSASFSTLAGTGYFKVRIDKSTGIKNTEVLEKLSPAKKAIAEKAAVVDVTFTTNGSTSGLSGVIIIIPYTLAFGQSADSIASYCVPASGDLEKLVSSYSNDAVSAETTHFSAFAVCSESLTDEPSSGGGMNIGLIAGIAVGAVVLIGAAVLIMKRR